MDEPSESAVAVLAPPAERARPEPAPQPEAPEPPKVPCRVAWLAGAGTLERLAPTLKPLAIALIDELVELHVFCPPEADARMLPSPPVELVRYERPRWWALHSRLADDLAAEMRARRVQLVHALEAGTAPLVHKLAPAAGTGYVISSCRLGDAQRLHGKLDARVRAVLAASEQVQRDLLGRRVISAERIHLLRPGLVRVRRATCFHDPDHAVAIVVGASSESFSGLDAVLKSFARLKSGKYDCVFFIVGAGRAERRLRSLAEELGLKADLTFADRQPAWQLMGILRAADLYVSPAPADGVDMEALLAMAAGVPVVSVDSGVSDFLKDGRTTLMFRRGDAAELTTKLASLLDDHAAARGLAETALEYLGVHHSPTGMAEKTAGIYRRAVAELAEARRAAPRE